MFFCRKREYKHAIKQTLLRERMRILILISATFLCCACGKQEKEDWFKVDDIATLAMNGDTNALKRLIKQADKGNPSAQAYLGGMYIHGNNVGRNTLLGLVLLNKAAKQKNGLAYYHLGYYYTALRAKAPLYEKSLFYFKKKETLDLEYADLSETPELLIGHIYLKEDYAGKDKREAFWWFQISALKKNNPWGKGFLSIFYTENGVVDKNFEFALSLALQAKEGGDTDMTDSYIDALKADAEFERGEKAALAGNVDALIDYGLFYYDAQSDDERDPMKNKIKGLRYLAKAAKIDEVKAVDPFMQTAKKFYFEKKVIIPAETQNDKGAQLFLGIYMYMGKFPMEENVDEGLKWIEKATKGDKQYEDLALAISLVGAIGGNDVMKNLISTGIQNMDIFVGIQDKTVDEVMAKLEIKESE